MKLSRSVAAAMARDLRQARWKVLPQLTPLDALFLLNLVDDLELISEMNWHDSLSRRLKSHPEVWIENMELGKEEGMTAVDEMAEFEEEAADQMRGMMREPMTLERMKKGEDLLASQGAVVNLLHRVQDTDQLSLN